MTTACARCGAEPTALDPPIEKCLGCGAAICDACAEHYGFCSREACEQERRRVEALIALRQRGRGRLL